MNLETCRTARYVYIHARVHYNLRSGLRVCSTILYSFKIHLKKRSKYRIISRKETQRAREKRKLEIKTHDIFFTNIEAQKDCSCCLSINFLRRN